MNFTRLKQLVYFINKEISVAAYASEDIEIINSDCIEFTCADIHYTLLPKFDSDTEKLIEVQVETTRTYMIS